MFKKIRRKKLVLTAVLTLGLLIAGLGKDAAVPAAQKIVEILQEAGIVSSD